MFKFSYGMFVVGTRNNNKNYACLINTAIQVTSSPLQISMTINKDNATCKALLEKKSCTLSVLSQDVDMKYIGRFGFRCSDTFEKFDGIKMAYSKNTNPYTPECSCAVLDLDIVNTLDVGSHIIFVGEVVDAEVLSDARPITYDYYHNVLKGKTPPKASSYIEEKKVETKHKFRCSVCGYIHEINEDSLPVDFRCPICGVGADKFEKIS